MQNNKSSLLSHILLQEELKTQEEYLLAKFLYTIDDTYECPQGETKTTGRWHKKPDAQSKVDTNLRNTVPSL
jgi:hypothetical protein